ncbi:MAG: PAS domain S-box protein, partial [Actinomycetota bacterium]|nr:PAS domain S-box protein [Actinomycetota bacterium]
MTYPDSSAHYDGGSRRDAHGVRGQADGEETSFRRLVEHSPDGIVVHRDGRVAYANLTAIRWIGAQYADQVRGHPFAEFVHPDSIESVLTRMTALRNEGDVTRPSEGVLVRLDGTTLDVEAVTALTTWDG